MKPNIVLNGQDRKRPKEIIISYKGRKIFKDGEV